MRRILILATSALAVSCGGALADARATGAPENATPTFGAWTLRCGAAPAGGERACEVDSMITMPGQKQPIAQIAFGRPARDQAKDKPVADKKADKSSAAEKDKPPEKDAKSVERTTKLVILVPVNVTIAPGINVIPDAAKPPLNIALKTCIQAACFAELELNNEQLQAFRNRTQPGQIIFTDPGGKPVVVELSFNGLDQALDALDKH